jgi:signal transduction histidine kinase
MSTQVQPPTISLTPRTAVSGRPRRTAAYVGGIALLALAYFGAAKVGQSLRYTASVAAMWPPAGVGIAALYLWGLRWWPGVLLGDLVVNAEQHFSDPAIPLGSLLGQQTGNMAEIVLGAALLTHLIGRRAALDRVEQVIGMLAALAVAAATSATVGTLSMLAGGVVDGADVPTFWRTWWLGDLSGALVVVAAALAWSAAPAAAWCRLRTREGALMIATVVLLGVLAVTIEEPVTYVVFPALIWAALRFGPPGAALAMVIASGLAIGITAAEVGPFAQQTIDHRTLATQLFIAVTALTTLILSAVVCERERSAKALIDAKLREGERAIAERQRIARELHDSVSQALFSTLLHTRMAQRSLQDSGAEASSPPAQALNTIADLTRDAQSEMRALISELGSDPLAGGLVPALERHAAKVAAQDKIDIRLDLPRNHPSLEMRTEAHLFGIAREGLANAVKHAEATQAWIGLRVLPDRIVLEIGDDGRGFDPAANHPEHFGLESMRTRAAEIDARLTIASGPGEGTVVRAELASPRPG